MTRTVRATGGALPAELLSSIAGDILAGEVIAVPTDTVYGLVTTGLDPKAAQRLYALKGRDSRKPLPILVQSSSEAQRWVEWNSAAQVLAEKFWPGPLTLVLRPTPEGRRLASPGCPTVALRVPAHPAALSLLKASDVPWASTSANLSGSPALREGADVADAFAGRIAWVIDGGTCAGAESTVLDASGPAVRMSREGALKRTDIERVLGREIS